MKSKTFITGKVEIKQADNLITVIASDETLDRHGDVLPIDQWDLTKFLLSPRMLVDHNHEVASIVGKWVNTRIENGKLMMDAVFHDITELSTAVKEMVVQGFLDTVSVGFIFHGPENDGGRPSFELIETSWVTVPANPSARVVKGILDKGIPEDQKSKVKEFAKDMDLEESDDALPDGEDELPEDELNDEEPVEGDLIEDKTPESMVKAGWLIVESPADYTEWQKGYGDNKNSLTLCGSMFLEKLLEDSEKLKTLTRLNADKAKAERHAKLVRESMREAARILNRNLQLLNQTDRV